MKHLSSDTIINSYTIDNIINYLESSINYRFENDEKYKDDYTYCHRNHLLRIFIEIGMKHILEKYYTKNKCNILLRDNDIYDNNMGPYIKDLRTCYDYIISNTYKWINNKNEIYNYVYEHRDYLRCMLNGNKATVGDISTYLYREFNYIMYDNYVEIYTTEELIENFHTFEHIQYPTIYNYEEIIFNYLKIMILKIVFNVNKN